MAGETYIDLYGLLHAQEQGIKVEVANCGLIHPLRITLLDFHTNPYIFHVTQIWQEGVDEV